MIYKGIAAEVAPYGISPIDVQVMMICLERRECTVTQLARLLPVDASRVSRLVTGLVDRGLLRRRRLRNDRRVVMLRLSPDGKRLTSELARKMRQYYAKVTDGFSERDMGRFAEIAMGIIANYEAMESE